MTDYSKNKETITNLIEKPLDSTLRAAIGNIANQQFTIDETGILGRKIEKAESGEDGETVEKFSPRQVRLINNVLLFTEDNWLTSSLALGEVSLDDNTTAYGLIADVLVGNLIMGSNLKISNESNTITLDESGITIKVPGEDDDGETVFSADNSGNVMLKGRIYATDGTIGGLTLSENSISAGNGLFSVDNDGVLTAKSGTIGGLKLTENGIYSVDKDGSENGNFKVTSGGIMTLNGASISGKITATSGTIGGFTIGSTALYNGISSMNSTDTGVYLGTNGLNLGGNFTVKNDGTVLIKKGKMQIGTETDDGTFTLNLTEQDISFNLALPTDLKTEYLTKLSPIRLEYNAGNGENKNHGGICMSLEGNTSPVAIPYTVVWGYPQLKLKATSSKDSEGDSGRNDTGAYIMLYNSGGIRIVARSGGSGTLEGTWTANDFTSDSDIRLKHSVEALSDKYEGLFDMLKPVRFKYKNGISNRYHTGLIAQDVYEAIESAQLSTNDFAAYVEKKDGSLCLCYQEFIALCIAEIQRLKRAINKIKPGYL